MKKVLQNFTLFLMAGAGICGGEASAQTAVPQKINLDKYSLGIQAPVLQPSQLQVASGRKELRFERFREINNTQKKSQNQPLGSTLNVTPPGTQWAKTYYDFQTNASMPNRLIYDKDTKILDAVWMAAEESDWSDRRTVYSAFDVADPSAPDAYSPGGARVEADRAGFPSIVNFRSNSGSGPIGISAHVNKNGTNIKFSVNGGSGEEAFNTYNVVPENPVDSSLWARSAVDGQGIAHVIYTFNETSPNADQIAYRRSTDQGKTWSEAQFLTGPNAIGGAKPSGTGGDAYAIAARGNTVAIVFSDGTTSTSGGDLNWWLYKSTDNGETWSKIGTIFRPQRAAYQYLAPSATGGNRYITDTTTFEQTAGTNMDVIIDSKGFVHAVATSIPTVRRGVGTLGSDDKPVITADTVLQLSFYLNQGLMYFNEEAASLTLIGTPAGRGLILNQGVGEIVSRRFGQGASRFPQLGLGEDDAVYCVYTSVVQSDFSPTPVPQRTTAGFQNVDSALYGHIFATHREAATTGWSLPISITPDGVDCLFGTLADNVTDGHLFVGYTASNTPGDRVTESDPTSGTTEFPLEFDEIFAYGFPIAQLNPVNVVDDNEISGFSTDVYPNPASNSAVVRYSVPSTGGVSIEVFSLIGQKIASFDQGIADGSRSASINTEAIPAGAYYVSVKWNGHSITKLLTVIK